MTTIQRMNQSVVKASVTLGLLSADDATECIEYVKGTSTTDELIQKLHFFKFGEHYRLLDEMEHDSEEVCFQIFLFF